MIARLIVAGSFVTSAAAPRAQPAPPLQGLRQPVLQGLRPSSGKPRYRFTVKSALVTPGRPDGRTWHGRGVLPPEIVKGLAKLAAEGTKLLMKESAGASIAAAGVELGIPWLADVLKGDDAPTVALSIFHRGSGQAIASPLDAANANTINPTWINFYTGEIELGEDEDLTIEAHDVAAKNSNRIGICTLVAPPRVDGLKFVAKESLRCEGGLVALSIRAEELTPAAPLTPFVRYPGGLHAISPPAPSATTSQLRALVRNAQPLPPPPRPARVVLAPPAALAPEAADPVASGLAQAVRGLPAGSVPATNIFHNRIALNSTMDVPVYLRAGCYWIAAASEKPARLLLSLDRMTLDTRAPKSDLGFVAAPHPVLGRDQRLCLADGFYRINVGSLTDAGTVGVVAYRLPR